MRTPARMIWALALAGSLSACGDDFVKIPAEVTNGGIDLGYCDLHCFSLIP